MRESKTEEGRTDAPGGALSEGVRSPTPAGAMTAGQHRALRQLALDLSRPLSEEGRKEVLDQWAESQSAKVDWTPVTEGLPEEGVNVLVTFVDYDGLAEVAWSRLVSSAARRWWLDSVNPEAAELPNVTAWMPLPPPYRGHP